MSETEQTNTEAVSESDEADVHPTDLIDLLEEHHQGRDNAITSGEIAETLGIDETRETNPDTRDLILEAIRDYDTEIASGPTGYFVITSQAEMDRYEENIESRIEGTRHRLQLVQEAWENSERGDDA